MLRDPATQYGFDPRTAVHALARVDGRLARLIGRKKDVRKPKELEAYGERWQPYRTAASWYLWRLAELPARASKRAMA